MPFCKYCGTELKEGQPCTCEESQTEIGGVVQGAVAAQSTVVTAAKRVKPFVSEFIIHPEKAIRDVIARDDVTLAVTLAVIRVITMGLLTWGVLHNIVSAIKNTAVLSGLLNSDYFYNPMMMPNIKAPFLSIFLWGSVIGLAGMGLFMLLAFCMTKLCRGKLSFKSVFEACAANSVVTTVILLLAFLMTFVSLPITMVLIAMAALVWIITGLLTVQVICPDNISGRFWLLYILGVLIVIVLGWFIIPKLILAAMGVVAVTAGGQTVTLKTGIDYLKQEFSMRGLWNELLDEILSGIF